MHRQVEGWIRFLNPCTPWKFDEGTKAMSILSVPSICLCMEVLKKNLLNK